MTKQLRKAIMRRSFLENKYQKNPTEENLRNFKKHKNFTSRLARRTKKEYFSKLDIKSLTDTKQFYKHMKPFLGNANAGAEKIILIEDENVICQDKEVAETFSSFFTTAVHSLDIPSNDEILSITEPLN